MSELDAGRELDELIAEKVMGWTRWAPKNLRWRDTQGEWAAHAPAYSADIAAAWLVVEKLSRPGFQWRITEQGEYYVACEVMGEDARWVTVAEGESSAAPHAICLAALAAAESERSTS